MEFTGERLVPGVEGVEDLYAEHMSRYLLAARLAAGKSVLDVGCGCGYGTHLLAARGAEHALGVDISPDAVEFAARRYARPNLKFEVMDCRLLPRRRDYDLITCFELIEHVEEDVAVVESLAGALAAGGVCLISTPNASTYVAGGEGGTNPYHAREYHESEFKDLLKRVFPNVFMLEQRWTGGLLIGSAEAGLQDGWAEQMPDDTGEETPAEITGPAAFYIAICRGRESSGPPEILARPFAALAGDRRYLNLKAEYDKRGGWAKALDAEIREKDARISALRSEIENQRREFDRRGAWAKDLDRKIEDKDRLIEELMQENQELKGVKAAAGKGNPE